MKNVLWIFLMLLMSVQINGQEISVESFRPLENDMDAKIHNPRKDVNGNVAAIIKVVTTETGFSFDTGSLAIVGTEQKPGEIWVYVQPKVRKITVRHPVLGVLRDYDFGGQSIKSATVYEMKLVTSRVRTIVEEDAGGQYWVLKVMPTDIPTEVIIDNNMTEILQNGILQKFMPYGKHNYILKSPYYNTVEGDFVIGREKVITSIDLIPNYSCLHITSIPEENIDIFINEEKVGKTPLVTDRISEGPIRLRAISPMFEPYEKTIYLSGKGDTLSHTIQLTPNYAEVEVRAELGTEIYINDEKKAKGNWKGRLTEGLYKIEGIKPGYRKAFKSINVVKGNAQIVELENLEPIYGTLNINVGNVSDVQIFVDGNDKGMAPNILSDVLTGTRHIRLVKSGYKSYETQMLIEEGRFHTLNVTMEKGMDATKKIFNLDSIVDNNTESPKRSELIPDTNNYRLFGLYTISPSLYYGGMIGFCKTFGWYAKTQILLSLNKDRVNYDVLPSETNQYKDLKKKEKNFISITTGPMYKLQDWLYVYAGLGYGDSGQYYAGFNDNSEYEFICTNRCNGITVEGGTVVRVGPVALSAGYSTILGKVHENEKKYADFHIGLGFSFRVK